MKLFSKKDSFYKTLDRSDEFERFIAYSRGRHIYFDGSRCHGRFLGFSKIGVDGEHIEEKTRHLKMYFDDAEDKIKSYLVDKFDVDGFFEVPDRIEVKNIPNEHEATFKLYSFKEFKPLCRCGYPSGVHDSSCSLLNADRVNYVVYNHFWDCFKLLISVEELKTISIDSKRRFKYPITLDYNDERINKEKKGFLKRLFSRGL